jgi:2-methylcitrate dehydratase
VVRKFTCSWQEVPLIMSKPLQNRQIAAFAHSTRFEDIGSENIERLKRHLLDTIGSILHACDKPAIKKLMRQIQQLGEGGKIRVPVIGNAPLDRAAQLYTALLRYPDFMDNFMGKEATCHPSDNVGALLAASQCQPTAGKDFLTAMAIAYEMECRLVEEIPVMKEGIDHTLFLSYSIVSSLSRLLGLTEEQTAHALGIAGSSISPMAVSRASYTYEWKGFASSLEAMVCVNTTLLAKEGMTGPIALFEGPKGFDEVFGMKLDFDWSKEDFSLLKKIVLKPYNAEVHTQSALEAALELKNQHNISPEDIKEINITTFLTAYHITGSGAYGDRKQVETKEQADHSLFYLTAVALLDGEVYPAQFETERINRKDVQELLQKVFVHTKFPLHKPLAVAGTIDPYTRAYPDKVMTRVEIEMNNGKKFSVEKEDHCGFHTRPFDWAMVIEKFRRLSSSQIDSNDQDNIIEVIQNLEHRNMDDLLDLINIGSETLA